ncbi:MAG: adenylate/guanylate cyclase domain-containing protein [Lewinellaceae bacterium]|nr:adenylate/guanylate cyclase domain-containing protein [Lewinellaceae bacterium]
MRVSLTTSVLFADFVGFSKIAEVLSPQQLVSELDTCFRAFDQIIALHGIEKIKTIGDAYMCAGGLPNGGGPHCAIWCSLPAIRKRWLSDWKIERVKKAANPLRRVSVSTTARL